MTLVKTSVLSAIAVLVKLVTSLFLNKVLAIYVGPVGYAVIGQFQSLVSMITTFASGAVNQGVIKYTAEYANEPEKQHGVWRTAAVMGLVGALICGCVLVLMRSWLSRWLLGTDAYASVLAWLGASLTLLVMNGLLLAILNGRKAVRELVATNVVGSATTALVATWLVMWQGLWGALLALAVSQALAFGFTAFIFQKTATVQWRELFRRIDRPAMKSLAGFALMAATTALVAPVGQMIIRDQLAADLGWSSAGLWQALWKISETHLLLLTSTLSVYFLPRFSEIREGSELRKEVLKGYRFVIPVVLGSALILYGFRIPLIRTLLTSEFLPLADVLGMQLLGDVLKISSWVVSFTMISHARTQVFVITEVLFTALFVVFTVLLSKAYGLQGAAMAYCATYLVYWATMYWLFNVFANQLRGHSASSAASA